MMRTSERMNPPHLVDKRGKTRKKRSMPWLLFPTALILLLVLPALFLAMTLEKSPVVTESKIADVDDAARVRALLGNAYKIIFHYTDADSLIVSEEDLNAALAFMARGITRFAGRAEVTEQALTVAATVRVPHNPIGDYVNFHTSLRPSDSGLDLAHVRIGNMKYSGRTALFIARIILNIGLGEKQGSLLLDSIDSILLDDKNIEVSFIPLPELNFDRLRFFRRRVEGLRDYISPLGDPLLVRIYYEKLIELEKMNRGRRPVSLAAYLHPLFQLARQRSEHNAAEVENHAALMALAMFAGSPRFEHLIGPVRTEELNNYYPRTGHIVLAGRYDLRLHFIISAGLKLVAESGMSYAAGEFKELLDAGQGGSGFSFADLAADRAGIRFAEMATDRASGARRLQSVLAADADETLFFPRVDDLREGLTQYEFESSYGGIENEEYHAVVRLIDRRIDQLPAYKTSGEKK